MESAPVSSQAHDGKRGRNGPRSRAGCKTCRLKKVKCDEARPRCQRCTRLRRLCDYPPDRETVRQDEHGRARTSAGQGTMTIQLPQFTNSACSLDLDVADHEAIRYFRTTFARLHHTKNPDFSLYSIMFTIAEREPLVMHALLALGGRDVESRRPGASISAGQLARQHHWNHLHHYSAALRSLADVLATGPGGQSLQHLDMSCTALYLMLLYEQKYGDADCAGLSNHLRGAAMMIRHHGRAIKEQLEAPRLRAPPALSRAADTNRLSLYSARILVWISLCDAAAASYGVGGAVCAALRDILAFPGDTTAAQSIERLHTFSNSLFRTMWAKSYPQAELLDDIENRSVYELMVCSSQARHAVAELALASDADRLHYLEAAMSITKYVTTQYNELLEVASELSPSTRNSSRLVANLRAVAPHYHAAVVLLAQLAGDDAFIYGKVDIVAHMVSITNFAKQMIRHEGDAALVRIAWPLLVVAFATESQQQRDWVTCRFQALSHLGKNMERAWEVLVASATQPTVENPWRHPLRRFRSGDGHLFVI